MREPPRKAVALDSRLGLSGRAIGSYAVVRVPLEAIPASRARARSDGLPGCHLNAMARPQATELRAAGGQVADKLSKAGIVDVGSDDSAQPGDGAVGGGLPVVVQVAYRGLQEYRTHEVDAGGEDRRDRRGL